MPKKGFKFTRKAVEDLSSIWNYTFDTWSEKQADFYYKSIIEGCELIALNPEIGRKYPKIQSSLFGLKINKHIIFYRDLNNNEIEVVRILHERMDLKNRLKE